MIDNNKNTKNIAVLQVLPHLDSGGLVSGAVEVSAALPILPFILLLYLIALINDMQPPIDDPISIS